MELSPDPPWAPNVKEKPTDCWFAERCSSASYVQIPSLQSSHYPEVDYVIWYALVDQCKLFDVLYRVIYVDVGN